MSDRTPAPVAADHGCWWTRRHESELSRRGTGIFGAGLPRIVLEGAARHLGHELIIVTRATPDDELNDDASIELGPWEGHLHDGCFVHFDRPGPELVEALVVGALALHAGYLNTTFPPGIATRVRAALRDETTIRLRSITARRQLLMKQFPVNSGWWTRLMTPSHSVLA